MTELSKVRLNDGRQLAFQEYGDPGGSPVFFFHGWLGSRLDFAPNDQIAYRLNLRVISVDRPGCGESDFKKGRKLLDWADDIAELADNLGFGRFGIIGHSFGGAYVAACAYQLKDRVTAAAIVAGISPLAFKGSTRGMPVMVRLALWAGSTVPFVVRPYVTLMSKMASKPSFIKKGMASLLPSKEIAMLDDSRFDGFFDNLGEMTKHGSRGAFVDAKAFLGKWDFECADIEMPLFLFYGSTDKNVPLQMGQYYHDAVSNSALNIFEDEGHFIMYSRAEEILKSLSKDGKHTTSDVD
jgi:pimeloyl-ACP methyl ester carboxylesterase